MEKIKDRIIKSIFMLCMVGVCWLGVGSSTRATYIVNVPLVVNTSYQLKYLDYNKEFTAPGNGRVRLVIQDCTTFTLSQFSFRPADGSSFVKKNWFGTTEDYVSNWITVREGWKYEARFDSSSNSEATFMIEFQDISTYDGEVEKNNTYNTANEIKNGVVYHGTYSYYGDVDI